MTKWQKLNVLTYFRFWKGPPGLLRCNAKFIRWSKFFCHAKQSTWWKMTHTEFKLCICLLFKVQSAKMSHEIHPQGVRLKGVRCKTCNHKWFKHRNIWADYGLKFPSQHILNSAQSGGGFLIQTKSTVKIMWWWTSNRRDDAARSLSRPFYWKGQIFFYDFWDNRDIFLKKMKMVQRSPVTVTASQ